MATANAAIDFEGLGDGVNVPAGYAGMNWDGGASPIMSLNGPAAGGGYGVMGTMLAFNPWEATPTGFYDPEGDDFQLVSFDFIAAWYTSLTYDFEGYNNGASTGQVLTANVGCFAVTNFVTGWTLPIDEVKITFVGSDYVEGYPGIGSGLHYGLDNIVIPAPASLSLLALGALVRRRR
ncbi:MAG: hypothetical protein KAS72_12630 [Phycisphaerales bacterium]|nr:hypothetical protein [Phycisphaerales bacterium]